MDKKEIRNLTKFVYVDFPYYQEYIEKEGFDEHSVVDIGSGGFLIEYDWLMENTPDHNGCSPDELTSWIETFKMEFGNDDELDEESRGIYKEALSRFILEMESGTVGSIYEFAEKHNLDL